MFSATQVLKTKIDIERAYNSFKNRLYKGITVFLKITLFYKLRDDPTNLIF